MINALQTKVCSKCNISKPLDRFGAHKRTQDRLNYHCKDCINAQSKIYKSRASKPCRIEGCTKFATGHGYCSKHYSRLLRNGSPMGGGTMIGAPMEFIKTVALPYTGDDCLEWPFARLKNGYTSFKYNGDVMAHRVICKMAHGYPKGEMNVVAHSCGNGHLGCVNPRHLRWATQKENMQEMVMHGRARNQFTSVFAATEVKP